MSNLGYLRLRRAAVRADIAAMRGEASEACSRIRADIGAAMLGLSIARLFGRGPRLRGFLAVAAGAATAFAVRALSQPEARRDS